MMSPAAIELARCGITGQSLADELGLTRAAVSFQLVGRSAATSPRLLEAVAARGGEDLARTVDMLIRNERNLRRMRRTITHIQELTSRTVWDHVEENN